MKKSSALRKSKTKDKYCSQCHGPLLELAGSMDCIVNHVVAQTIQFDMNSEHTKEKKP